MTKNKTVLKMTEKKRGPGRPKKESVVSMEEISEGVAPSGLFQPTKYDILDELSRFDSFAYADYTN